ncbi:MAG: hypothetical protein IJZ34_07340, partial [Lachnospiraceae bacterium]|nr:hypothetical protein [Lachnospiraceae bacterium]
MPYMREVFRPVTVINREYNRNFYDNQMLVRTFDVYNDTLHIHDCTIRYRFVMSGQEVASGEETYPHNPAQHYIFKVQLPLAKVAEKTDSVLEIKLYHEDELKFENGYHYTVYPETIKTETVDTSRQIYYFGNTEGFDRISALNAGARQIQNISDVPADALLILGAHLDVEPNKTAEKLEAYLERGGVAVVLEQDVFAMGNLCLQNQDFFSAYSGNPEHPILKGIRDEDLIFWGQAVTEDKPEPIIHRNFMKPQSGEYTFVLESGAGDYADGGDLWSPLMTMKHGKGTIVFCQIEISENYEQVPQATILLRNLISYAGNIENNRYKTVSSAGMTARQFLTSINVEYQAEDDISASDIVVADVTEADAAALKQFVQRGGVLVTLPFDEAGAEKLCEIIDGNIKTNACEVSHLKPVCEDEVISDISPFDLYRYDKVAMSPRLVENKRIALRTVECADSKPLLCDVPGTPWEDYYWNRVRTEVAIIPLVSINREKVKEKDIFLAKKEVGRGMVILSQLKADGTDEKDIRVYTRILENLGAKTKTELFEYQRSAKDYAVDYFMTLPIQPWQDYDKAKAYYTDPRFSLNNLGEGLYGWMKKLEKNRADGFITVPDSQGKRYFLTCFADKEQKEKVKVMLECNTEAHLYLNGKKQLSDEVVLEAGVNRIIIEAQNKEQDLLKLRMTFLSLDGHPVRDLKTHLTIDEVEPK